MEGNYQGVLSRLSKVRWHPNSKMWSARCPAHDDRNPSLLVWVGKEGRLLARCKSAGCTWEAIVEATGTRKQDWFPPMSETQKQQERGKIVATYDYQDERGNVLYQCCRIEPGYGGNRKRFSYRRPQTGGSGWVWNLDDTEKVLYRLPELLDEKRKAEPVYVVEGEKDVETLRALGLLATTSPCGAMAWDMSYGKVLAGRRVVIIPDKDEPGQRHAVQVAGSLVYWHARKLAIVHLPALPEGGDVTDWLADFKTKEDKIAALVGVLKSVPKWERV